MDSIYPTDNFPVPIRIVVERRNYARISLGKKEIIIRIPKSLTNTEKQKTILKFLSWATEQIQKKQLYINLQNTVEYYQNKKQTIYDKEFIIQIHFIKEGKNKLSFRADQFLYIYLLEHQTSAIKIKEIQRFLLRFTEKYFIQTIQQRTLYWNELYFKERIEKIVLKHTISCWGSCTTKRRLSFSTKLLLAPSNVIDYVIIHELAHLKEMNHSARFWKHVENVMVDYRTHRSWLKQYGHTLDF